MLIYRSWRQHRLGCVVFTGRLELRRGSIDCVGIDALTGLGIWRVRTLDSRALPDMACNYLEAERALLDATADLGSAHEALWERRRDERLRCAA